MRISIRLRRATAVAAAMSLILGLPAAAPAVLAAGVTASTTTIGVPMLDPKPVGLTTDLTADVMPSDATGTVTFYDVTGGGKVEMGSGTLGLVFGTIDRATWTVPADFPAGDYLVMAEYGGDGTYAASDSSSFPFRVGPRSTATQVTVSGPHDPSGATVEKGDTITIGATVTDNDTYTPNPVAVNGTLTIKLDGTTIGSFAAPTGSVDVSTSGAAWTLAAHTITASYDPGLNTDHTASASSNWPITVVANTVMASAGVQYTTFYPYKDGYRDYDAIRGNRLETASVKIKITSPTGSTVKQVSIGAGLGAWNFSWNGRNSSGVMLAAGKYTVRQTVTDAKGLSKTFTSYVTISPKRLYTYTVALKKTAAQVTKNGGTWFGWTFTLPGATVYKKLVFSVYGKSGLPAGLFGPHNYTYCPSTTTWNWGSCMVPWTTFPTTASWKSITGSTTANRHGTTVRMYAVGGYRTAVAYARVTVTYAVLK